MATHRLAVGQIVGWVHHQQLVATEPGKHFDAAAVVATEFHRDGLGDAAIHRDDLDSLRRVTQRRDGHVLRRLTRRHRKPYLHVRPRKDAAIFIR